MHVWPVNKMLFVPQNNTVHISCAC